MRMSLTCCFGSSSKRLPVRELRSFRRRNDLVNAGNRIIPAIEPEELFGGGSRTRTRMRGGITERVQDCQNTVGGTIATYAGIRGSVLASALSSLSVVSQL